MEFDPPLGNCGFSLRLPKTPQYGDEIAIKAVLRNDAERFSINLCLDRPDGCDPNGVPEWIAYHFGLDYSEGGEVCKVTQCSKNVNWVDPCIAEDDVFKGRTVNIIVRLDEASIKVFHEDTQHAPDYEYNHQFPIEQICIIELRDGIDRVEEIRLKYNA